VVKSNVKTDNKKTTTNSKWKFVYKEDSAEFLMNGYNIISMKIGIYNDGV